MYVTLKMNIEDQEIRLEANLTNRAGRIYREYFGHDLVDDMTDIYKKTHKNPFEGIDFSQVDFQGKTENEVSTEILNLVVPKYLGSQITSPLSFEDTEKGCFEHLTRNSQTRIFKINGMFCCCCSVTQPHPAM